MTASHDRTRPPAPGTQRPTPLPSFERHALPNGLELALAPRQSVPLVELELLVPAGAERNPVDRPGLASLTAALLDEGTAKQSGPELAAALERRGGGLGSSAEWSATSIRVSLPSSELDFGLELLSELLLEPAFPEHEVERLRRQSLAELARRLDQPAALAEEAFARNLYAGTVYGHLLLGSADFLATVTRNEIVAFHHLHHRLAGSQLVISGAFDSDGVVAAVAESFAHAASSTAVAPPEVSAPGRQAVSIVVVDRPHAAQTELRLGHVGVPRTHPNRTGLGFLNTLLGGKFTSRINLNLRERHGITYGAHSRFADRRSAGPFVVSVATSNSAAGLAAREILGELHRLRDEPVGAFELEETRSFLLGIFPYGLQTIEGLAARLRDIALYGLPLDHAARTIAEYQRLSAEDLLDLARAHLAPEACLIVAVGPAAEIGPQLEDLGPLEIQLSEAAASPTR